MAHSHVWPLVLTFGLDSLFCFVLFFLQGLSSSRKQSQLPVMAVSGKFSENESRRCKAFWCLTPEVALCHFCLILLIKESHRLAWIPEGETDFTAGLGEWQSHPGIQLCLTERGGVMGIKQSTPVLILQCLGHLWKVWLIEGELLDHFVFRKITERAGWEMNWKEAVVRQNVFASFFLFWILYISLVCFLVIYCNFNS